ncbi:hypothetical protein [Tenggerimyces flavus]|uniref:Uncharacterized protein n=1 Tax=Tenggerimyces flavus TaxID=1708749 RepID=A0ABV7Y357_9ACTN|nr:hypothetical protein [Tenggerimyces flavus]MBM7790344.1 hypothetical protein [Tenggerimyces flavus]
MITVFVTALPAVIVNEAVDGRVSPVGHNVKPESAVELIDVTANATADTPDDGTPPTPVTV